MIEHCLQEYKDRTIREAFDAYNSEILRSLNNATVKAWGGTEYKMSFKEMLDYKPETRTGDEIKDHMKEVLSKFGE